MAIYLDANILHSWKTFAEVERVALTIVAQQIQQRVLIPDVAAWEAEAHYRRELERAEQGLKRAHKGVVEAFRGEVIAPVPPLDVEGRVSHWRDQLSQFAEAIRLEQSDA